MSPRTPIKKPTEKNVPLDFKVKHANSFDKQIISEQKKEIVRLQKLLAKTKVKHESEIAKVRAEEFEKYRIKHLQITPETNVHDAARIYAELMDAGKS